jgi:RNA polymerase sigma-70 factor (sigma-E family)
MTVPGAPDQPPAQTPEPDASAAGAGAEASWSPTKARETVLYQAADLATAADPGGAARGHPVGDPDGDVIDPGGERVSPPVLAAGTPPLNLMQSFDLGFQAEPVPHGIELRRTARRPRLTHAQVVELYEANHDGLLRFASLMAPEDGMAEDLVQEAFVRLYKSWGRIRDPQKVPAYLRSTVANLARGRGRRLGVAQRNRPAPGPDASSAEEGALRDESRNEVVAMLRTLPARQRECLVLRYYEGLNETEIAKTLGISVGSVRTHTSRGMAAMQQRLGGLA